jgi:hypothetical protein
MNQNIGMADRIVRIILAVIFIILALRYSPWWYIPAILALLTGITGWCGLYVMFGWDTCSCPTGINTRARKTKPKKKK